MTDLLRRDLAPITPAAWKEIDDNAARILKTQLTARTLVDFSGPHGWEFAGVNTGRLQVRESGSPSPPWGVREVLPLVEVRLPFRLDQMELDCVSRGSRDVELGPLEEAARQIALFEESAVYRGFPEGGIEGIIPATVQPPVALPDSPTAYPQAVAVAARQLHEAGYEPPFALVLGGEAWAALRQAGTGGYPPQRLIADLIGGPILLAHALTGGLLLSTATGNFELTVGQDLSIGYASHDRREVELYLTESFTFRVLQDDAAVLLEAGG